MRGEETQLLGAEVRDGQVVLPGTHSKWATLSRGEIETFRTAMTGELYAVLLDHSLLGRLAVPSARQHDDAFTQGVARSLEDPSLVLTLFSVRASVLTGCLSGEAVGAYLSGLLIGAEVAAMIVDPTVPLTLIGGEALCQQYSTALALAGVHDLSCISGDAAMSAGLWRIWKEWTCN
jgi:2-dehydro-3-deoxygalactonokinase